jgi:hypothetical protein
MWLYEKNYGKGFNSLELKAQVSFSDRPLSGVRLSVRPSENFYIFDFSTTTGPILTRLVINHLWMFFVCLNAEDRYFPRGDNSKRVKTH